METISQNIMRDSGLAMFKWAPSPWRLKERRGQAGEGAGSPPTPQSQQLHLTCELCLNTWAPHKILFEGEGKGAIKKKRKKGSNQLFMV